MTTLDYWQSNPSKGTAAKAAVFLHHGHGAFPEKLYLVGQGKGDPTGEGESEQTPVPSLTEDGTTVCYRASGVLRMKACDGTSGRVSFPAS